MKANGFLEYHKTLFNLLKSQDSKLLTLRGRLRFCLVLLSAALLGCTFFLMAALDFLPSEKNDTSSQLSLLLDEYHRHVASYCSTLAGQGIRLSQRLSSEFEQELDKRQASLSHLYDNPQLIEALEDRSYRILEDTLHLADCSGVFVVLDANGKVLHTQDSSFLEEDKGYSEKKVLRFFKNWTPAAVKKH